jgi:hypothetical protein
MIDGTQKPPEAGLVFPELQQTRFVFGAVGADVQRTDVGLIHCSVSR